MRSSALFTATCLVLLAAGQATAEDKQMNEALDLVSGPPEQCLSLIRIERSEVVDDRNILFHMRNGDIYRNQLPYRCSGLSPGASCGLGHFYPVTEEQAEKLKEMAGS
ncbi:hypothetical protein [Lentisalinibacter salinarum]|uniref:hypothetical protein n=1 Tax=Lentisalinibacter salinarum TaxID=2992239 RepID=UPI0038670430